MDAGGFVWGCVVEMRGDMMGEYGGVVDVGGCVVVECGQVLDRRGSVVDKCGCVMDECGRVVEQYGAVSWRCVAEFWRCMEPYRGQLWTRVVVGLWPGVEYCCGCVWASKTAFFGDAWESKKPQLGWPRML